MSQIHHLLQQRASTRSFLSKMVDKQDLTQLFEQANLSASGSNLQPWKAYVVAGEAKTQIIDAIAEQINQGKTEDNPHVSVYPDKLTDTHKKRRFECGMALYEAMGIKREDKDKRSQQWQSNYQFFGAPVGILITIDANMGSSQYIDLGIYMQSLMLLAQEAGLNTCPQLCWSSWPDTCGQVLQIPDSERVVVGLSLGYADKQAGVNQYRTSRAQLDQVVSYRGI